MPATEEELYSISGVTPDKLPSFRAKQMLAMIAGKELELPQSEHFASTDTPPPPESSGLKRFARFEIRSIVP